MILPWEYGTGHKHIECELRAWESVGFGNNLLR